MKQYLFGQPETEVIYLPPAKEINSNPSKKFNTPPIPIFVEEDENLVAELYLPKGFNKKHIERVIKVLRAYVE